MIQSINIRFLNFDISFIILTILLLFLYLI